MSVRSEAFWRGFWSLFTLQASPPRRHRHKPVKPLKFKVPCPTSCSIEEALRGDWERVGGDFTKAMKKVSTELRPDDDRAEKWDKITAELDRYIRSRK